MTLLPDRPVSERRRRSHVLRRRPQRSRALGAASVSTGIASLVGVALLVLATVAVLPAPARADTLGGRSALEIHAEQHILMGNQQARRNPGSFGASGSRTPELVWSSELARLARNSSDRMASRGAMGHDPRVGDTLAGSRHGDNTGYRSAGATTTAAAARAHATSIFKAWMASNGHRQLSRKRGRLRRAPPLDALTAIPMVAAGSQVDP